MINNYDINEYTKEDEKIVDSFIPKDSLSDVIFEDESKMHSEIRKKLIDISNEYIDFIGIEFFIHDIVITGSLSNYNWSNYSDIDLHIIVDFEDQKYSVDIMKEFFDAKEKAWKSKHDIKIKNYDVEIYVQDLNEKATSTGIYSILKDKWVTKPVKQKISIDDEKILSKSDEYTKKIDDLLKKSHQHDVMDDLKKIYKKIKNFRQTGLDKGGEYSFENLTFKLLRRNGSIKKLLDLKSALLDKKLSIE